MNTKKIYDGDPITVDQNTNGNQQKDQSYFGVAFDNVISIVTTGVFMLAMISHFYRKISPIKKVVACPPRNTR